MSRAYIIHGVIAILQAFRAQNMSTVLNETVVDPVRAEYRHGQLATRAACLAVLAKGRYGGLPHVPLAHCVPREVALERPMVAKYSQLKQGLEHAEPVVLFVDSWALTHAAVHDILGVFVLSPFLFCQGNLDDPVLATWEV